MFLIDLDAIEQNPADSKIWKCVWKTIMSLKMNLG